jgi:hypothetical protein
MAPAKELFLLWLGKTRISSCQFSLCAGRYSKLLSQDPLPLQAEGVNNADFISSDRPLLPFIYINAWFLKLWVTVKGGGAARF